MEKESGVVMLEFIMMLVLFFILYELIKTKNEIKFFRNEVRRLLEKNKDV